jgi:alkaline phosphatase D
MKSKKPLTAFFISQPGEVASPPNAPARRKFVRDAATGAVGALALSSGLSGCGSDDNSPAIQVNFAHGVASGDPLADRIILWTRITADTSGDVPVRWEIASDSAFATIIASGDAAATAARDYTVKVDATGLKAATVYFYRFKAYANVSPSGKTRTLPTAGTAQVKLAVFSCANYPAGYFNVYADAAKRNDIDATVHLGDYIYEYSAAGYASGNAAALGRSSDPTTEILTLTDYRKRHSQYKKDADLQALHASAPMIAVWDDHEVANDAYLTGAENHQSATEGDFALRKAAALQAYHEWMPTRVAQSDIIYRSFDFGNLVSLHMLDTRLIGRDKQLDYNNYFKATGFDAAAFTADVGSTTRQLMGATQTAWLQQKMAASTATWQVLGQQVLMGRMNIPAPILAEAQSPGSGVTVSQYAAIVAKATNAPTTLTPTEQAILAQPSIPYNLDAWDGYYVARETVLGSARSLNKNLVVLSGDTHNAWANDLKDRAGNQVGVEFATSSVTSPGFEEYLPNENPAVLAASLTQLIAPLEYCDTSRRGYMLLTATASECRADWVFVSTISNRSYSASLDKSLRVLPGETGRKIVAV